MVQLSQNSIKLYNPCALGEQSPSTVYIVLDVKQSFVDKLPFSTWIDKSAGACRQAVIGLVSLPAKFLGQFFCAPQKVWPALIFESLISDNGVLTYIRKKTDGSRSC